MEFQEKSIEHLISVIRDSPKPILLLGAGASIKSGIPGTAAFVERAAAWAYAKEKQYDHDDIRIKRSDWLPFLEGMSWYRPDKSFSENYALVFKYLLTPKEQRREFFKLILNPKVKPSEGYSALTELIANKYFDTILTTNFDSILHDVCKMESRIHHVEVIKSESYYSTISTASKYPQIIHLHGDVDNYTDKNDDIETQTLDNKLVRCILPLLKDHPLIIVGYRGSENSIMNDLFIQNASETVNYKHGIYWCILEKETTENLHPNIHTLQSQIGTNLLLVRIKGFDELFRDTLLKGLPKQQILSGKQDISVSNIFELQPIINASIDDLDVILLKQRIIQYSQNMRIDIPDDVTDDWLNKVLIDRDIIISNNGTLTPTKGGMLLFGTNPNTYIKSNTVQISVHDIDNYFKNSFFNPDEELNTEIQLTGNLWSQVNGIIDVLSAFNRQFILKGQNNASVTPYSSLALKELIVNALVHRDYSIEEPIKIEVFPRYIRIENPGGLVREVEDKLDGEPIEEVIKRGTRGIKGYRNTVLADLFYGTNTMEKRGSGLPDVFEETRRYSSQVTFGPTSLNAGFEAIIFARPEIVDEITNTAKQKTEYIQQFSTNVLELVMPEKVFVASTVVGSNLDIIENPPFQFLPPYLYWENKIIAFFDIGASRYGLSKYIDKGTLEVFSTNEFFDTSDKERLLVNLLNLTVFTHLKYRGLQIDRDKKRAYFEKNLKDDNNVQISYQARVKSATRTIVKKRVSSTTNQIIYWEHKSFSFRIEKFGNTYGLIILPNYTFTIDGYTKYLKPEKINILSTKRASRDYNIQYLNDLSFWVWVLTEGKQSENSMRGFPTNVELDKRFSVYVTPNFLKTTIISEDAFDTSIAVNEIDDAEDIYDKLDEIALAAAEEEETEEGTLNELDFKDEH